MQNTSKSFFGVRVLFDVNFRVRRGEVHALLGENGAGKSTLTKILSAVYRKESGEIILDGKPLHAERAQAVDQALIVHHPPKALLRKPHGPEHRELAAAQGDARGDGVEHVRHRDE